MVKNHHDIWDIVDGKSAAYFVLSDTVWDHPETNFEEYVSSDAHAAMLEAEGFRVSRGIAGLPTAVMGEAGHEGPVIAILGEFDALPGLSQTAGIPEELPVEAGGHGSALGQHAATLSQGKPGVLHGSLSYVLQDEDGQTANVHSCSAGLDYPGVGPEHAYWKESRRVTYTSITDHQALDAFKLLARLEGILPALETAHAIAEAVRVAPKMGKDQELVVNLSGRGDKDCQEVARLLSERG